MPRTPKKHNKAANDEALTLARSTSSLPVTETTAQPPLDPRHPHDDFIDEATVFVFTEFLPDEMIVDLVSDPSVEKSLALVRASIFGFLTYLSDPETGTRAELDRLWAEWDAHEAERVA